MTLLLYFYPQAARIDPLETYLDVSLCFVIVSVSGGDL